MAERVPVVIVGHPCPACGDAALAEVLHLEPPYGALVRCLAPHIDGRPCGHEFPVAF